MIFLGFVESFNGRLRDELLNEVLFSPLGDARRQIQARQLDYNLHRPHSALGNIPPAEFAMKTALEQQAVDRQPLWPAPTTKMAGSDRYERNC